MSFIVVVVVVATFKRITIKHLSSCFLGELKLLKVSSICLPCSCLGIKPDRVMLIRGNSTASMFAITKLIE